MSEKNAPRTTNAHDLQRQAVKWAVDRHISENWGKEEQNRLDAWLDESPAHLVAYWCAEDHWNRTYLLSALHAAHQPQNRSRRASWTRWGRRAAVVAAVATLGASGTFYFSKPAERTYTTALGGRETLTLGDGSKVELNTDTVLRIGNSRGQRSATLERGEAFFQIKHDPVHPFAVNVGNHRIVDIGTKFSVRTQADQMRVALVEGAARVDSIGPGIASPTLLKPGEVAVATANSVTLSKLAPVELNNELAWRRGILVFDNTPLGDVAAEFNRYNDKKIIIANENVGRMRIMGSFQTNDLGAVTSMAREMFHLRVAENSDEIVISR